MTDDRYPYRHHGPAVHGSKLEDYLISEANMIDDGIIPDPYKKPLADCVGITTPKAGE